MGPAQIISFVVSTALSVKKSQDEKKAAKRKEAIQQKQNDLKAKQEQAKLDREARKRRAAIINRAAGLGITGGSSIIGATQSLETQQQAGVELSQQQAGLVSQELGAQLQSNIDASNAGLVGGIIENVGIAQQLGDTVDNIFGEEV